MKPSELNAHPSRFNGETITVRGFVRIVPEGHNLYESAALDAEFRERMKSDKTFNPFTPAWKGYCLTIANPGPLRQHQANFNGKTITLTGKFVDDYLKPNMVDIGACPLPTALFVNYSDLQKRYPSLFK